MIYRHQVIYWKEREFLTVGDISDIEFDLERNRAVGKWKGFTVVWNVRKDHWDVCTDTGVRSVGGSNVH